MLNGAFHQIHNNFFSYVYLNRQQYCRVKSPNPTLESSLVSFKFWVSSWRQVSQEKKESGGGVYVGGCHLTPPDVPIPSAVQSAMCWNPSITFSVNESCAVKSYILTEKLLVWSNPSPVCIPILPSEGAPGLMSRISERCPSWQGRKGQCEEGRSSRYEGCWQQMGDLQPNLLLVYSEVHYYSSSR